MSLENKCALSNYDGADTPLGLLKIDERINFSLKSNGKYFTSLSPEQDLREHSLELQFPLIYKMFEDNPIKIVPIMVGYFTEDKFRKSVADAIIESIKDYRWDEVAFVISSDFCHYGQRFKFQPKFFDRNQSINEHISIMDHIGFSKLNSNNVINDFKQYLESTGNTICGQEAILLYLHILNLAGMIGEWIIADYSQ